MSGDIRFVVRRLRAEGRKPLPCKELEKATRFKGWQKNEATEADFSDGDNIAERLDQICDIDCDAPETRALAALVLPPTGRIHGRPSLGPSHYWYQVTGAIKSFQFKDTNGNVLVEIRFGSRAYTLIPPSVVMTKGENPVPETLTYFVDEAPGSTESSPLFESTRLLATAALLGRHWPNGSRHNAALAASGFLGRRMNPDDVETAVTGACRLAKDDEPRDRLRAIHDTLAALKADNVPVSGGPEFELIFGAAVLARLNEWFGTKKAKSRLQATERLTSEDFVAFLPEHRYFLLANSKPWTRESIRAHVKSPEREVHVCDWLDRNRHVDEITWAPGRPQFLLDVLVMDSGELQREGMSTLNLYRPAHPMVGGDPTQVGPWLQHLQRIYPTDWQHLVTWMAWRVQRPDVKINHALVLGGATRIGKDTILVPLREAVGEWNFGEVSPEQLMGRFNGFLKSVVLRVNEVRDLGDVNRYQLYERSKSILASPPEYFRVDEKNLREHPVVNIVGVIFTTNHKEGGLFLPDDDARHYVAWSEALKEEFFEPDEDQTGLPRYFKVLYDWYRAGGIAHVGAYLQQPSLLEHFDPKAPPPHTEAWHQIVASNRSPEESELMDVIDELKLPDAVILADLQQGAQSLNTPESHLFAEWLKDRKNRRAIPHRLEKCGYIAYRNVADRHDGQWKVEGQRQTIYVRAALSPADRLEVARVRAGEFRLQAPAPKRRDL